VFIKKLDVGAVEEGLLRPLKVTDSDIFPLTAVVNMFEIVNILLFNAHCTDVVMLFVELLKLIQFLAAYVVAIVILVGIVILIIAEEFKGDDVVNDIV
jgi:hypothetical protein